MSDRDLLVGRMGLDEEVGQILRVWDLGCQVGWGSMGQTKRERSTQMNSRWISQFCVFLQGL